MEIPQNLLTYLHIFALFDPPKNGFHLMIPVLNNESSLSSPPTHSGKSVRSKLPGWCQSAEEEGFGSDFFDENFETNILLMAEIRRKIQLRLVVYPIIYRVSYIQTVVVWDFSHQQ